MLAALLLSGAREPAWRSATGRWDMGASQLIARGHRNV
jgi:hypothetical protein